MEGAMEVARVHGEDIIFITEQEEEEEDFRL